MKTVYHRLAVRDVRQILDHYESEAGRPLADRFFSDFLLTVGGQGPDSASVVSSPRALRKGGSRR